MVSVVLVFSILVTLEAAAEASPNNFLVLPLQASHHFPTPPPNSQSQIDLGLATPFQVGLPSSDLTGSPIDSSDVDVIDEDPVPIRLMQPKIFISHLQAMP